MLILPTRLQPQGQVLSLFLRAGPGMSASPARRWVLLSFLLVAGISLAVLTSVVAPAHVDEPIVQAVQSVLPAWYEHIGWFFNYFLRDTLTPVLWAASVIGFLVVRRNDYAGLFLLTAINGPFTSLIKETVDRPRPLGDFAILHFPTDPSFPSGHTMTAMAFFGLWFIVAPRVLPDRAVLPARIVCGGAILFTGLSRIWAGAHWPSDVLGSIIWGTVFLLLVLMAQPLLERLNPRRATSDSLR